MDSLDEKLMIAYDNNNITKMKKYLKYGANPHVNNSTLFYESIVDNKFDALLLLLSYDTTKSDMHQIIRYACLNNNTQCLKELLKYTDLNEFKQTDTFEFIRNSIGVC